MAATYTWPFLFMKKGDKVTWKWGKGSAEGEIVKKHNRPIEKKIKGTDVKRNADKHEPAYEIKQEDGGKVIKSESEIRKN